MKRRSKKIASLMRAELSRVLLEEIGNPNLEGLTVTEVQLTDDLSVAKVFYVGGAASVKQETLEKELRQANGYLRKILGDRMELRRMPELRFVADTHTDSVVRVLNLLETISPEKEDRTHP